MTQNLVVATRQEARDIPRGTLEMCVCRDCGFAFNRAFDASLVGYGDHYDNTQSHSPSFKEYMDGLVGQLVEQRGVQNARIVEVGCGKGYFIHKLVERVDAGNVGWGFDPSYEGPDSTLDGRLVFRREYYGPGCESLHADVVICRHVIEHVADPVALLSTVRSATSRGSRVFFETPALEWILTNVVVWDLFYEHCSMFTPQSLTTAFERAGFSVVEAVPTFGSQYLWLEATVADGATVPRRDPGTIPELAASFGRAEAQWIERWTTKLRTYGGNVAIWGAGAKGVTFANLVDPDCRLIDCVVDLNPRKQNHFLPGTGHPIVAPAALRDRRVSTAILMNPNYREENLALLRSVDLDVALEEQSV